MHFEILVEDRSGKVMLEFLVPRLLGEGHTFEIHSYKGIGRIPKGMKGTSDPSKRILLDQLPKLLAGYGRTFASYGANYRAAVILVCDLDDRNRMAFARELKQAADRIAPAPPHAFCLAIEEGEAWLLGDLPAIKQAYPKAKQPILDGYTNDSICGTWEQLADAVYPGGAKALSAQGWQKVGQEKAEWAMKITPCMRPDTNLSPSFLEFVSTLKKFATA